MEAVEYGLPKMKYTKKEYAENSIL